MPKAATLRPNPAPYGKCWVVMLVVCGCALAGAQAARGEDTLAPEAPATSGIAFTPENRHSKVNDTHKHADIRTRLEQAEARCYQQFVVNHCLSVARENARTERAALDAQAHLEKSAARRAAADVNQGARERRIADHTTAGRSTRENAVDAPIAPVPSAAPAKTARASGKAPPAEKTQRERKAPAPSAKHDVERIRQERAAAQAQRDQRALRAQKRLAEKRATAQRRQAAIEQRRTDRAAQGKPGAAPLPPAPVPTHAPS